MSGFKSLAFASLTALFFACLGAFVYSSAYKAGAASVAVDSASNRECPGFPDTSKGVRQ